MKDLNSRLEALRIVVSQSDDGSQFTVQSNSEPLFCYVCDSEAEVDELVIKTLKSYARTFYGAKNVQVVATDAPLANIPEQRITPKKRLLPTFSFNPEPDGQPAAA